MMSKQIDFTSLPLDPKPEFRNRVPAVTEKRAEALLAACELLEVARQSEAIDLIQGAIGARATIIDQLAEFGSKPVTVSALRNLIVLAKILGEVNTEPLAKLGRELKSESAGLSSHDSPPSVWELTKRADHPDVRRGLHFLLRVTEALGQAVKS
jgi:uncharacterized protein YjgD (DUF1641 family)